jgi:hypothetical protein
MKRTLSSFASIAAASVLTVACGFQHSTNVLAPTSASAAASTPAGTPNSNNTSSTPSLVGLWTSAALPAVPSPNTCGNFQFQVISQTATALSGTFTAVCGGGMAISGTASGTVNGTAVAITVSGSANVPGTPSCAFNLAGTGAVIDNGYTLTVPFTGTTCLGPVSGTEVLHRPQPAAVAVTFGEPTLVTPTPNQIITTLHPTFTVADSTRSGPVGAVTYLIEIGNDIGFNTKFATWSTPEQPNQTVLDLPKDVAYSSVYYWHVRASDPTTVGPWSRTLAFATQDPPQPPNTSGQDAIDLHGVNVINVPRDVANWPITARISVLDFSAGGVDVEFTKKDGPGRWPDVTPPGWDGGIEYTLWMVENIGGQWYTAGGVEFWNGLGRSGGPPSRFASNWYYNPQVWGPLAGHQPAVGEQVGFFVTAGDARAKDVTIVRERSNVVVVPFPSDGGGYFPFAGLRVR